MRIQRRFCPCDCCGKSVPCLTSPMDQTGEVNIQYYPDYITTLDIDQYFSAVVAPTREQLNYYQGKRKVNSIDVDCTAVEIQDSQRLHFISNKIKGKGGIFLANQTVSLKILLILRFIIKQIYVPYVKR